MPLIPLRGQISIQKSSGSNIILEHSGDKITLSTNYLIEKYSKWNVISVAEEG